MHPYPGTGLALQGVSLVCLQEVVVAADSRQVCELCRAAFGEGDDAVVDLEVVSG
jgi:hypothetical protein